MSKRKRKILPEAVLFEIEGNEYCKNYQADNMTCVNCAQNREGPFRAGCFSRAK